MYLHLLLHLQLIVHFTFSCRLSQALRVKGRSQQFNTAVLSNLYFIHSLVCLRDRVTSF